ncbi:MAG: hypothetical protein WD009_15000 [Phycisphaeraceae bacterium]
MHDETFEPLHPDRLTWAALLAQWVEFARGAIGLPDDEAGRRLRDAVPDIIMLQAVWFALERLDELDDEQRALGIDRAGVLVERHAAALHRRWVDDPMPPQVVELIEDAERALNKARLGN